MKRARIGTLVWLTILVSPWVALGQGLPDEVTGVLEVTAVDYKFVLPAVIPKDATSIHLVNEGKEDHELLIGRMNDGVTLDQVKTATNLRALVPDTITLDAEPGQSAEMAIDVTAGNWFMACFLTTADGKSHAELGMIGEFTAP